MTSKDQVSTHDRDPPVSPVPIKRCHCRNSQCIKLYCECFRNERFCDGCDCGNCLNSSENIQRRNVIDVTRAKNGQPARAVPAPAPVNELASKLCLTDVGPKSKPQTCNCRNSFCRKKYCECFQEGRPCSEKCRCTDCKNDSPAEPEPNEPVEPPVMIARPPTTTREELRSKLLIRLLRLQQLWFPESS